jgi:DNA polymerase-1
MGPLSHRPGAADGDPQLRFDLGGGSTAASQVAVENAAKRLSEEGISPVFVTDVTGLDAATQDLCRRRGAIGFDIETAAAPGFEGDPLAGLDPYRSRIRLAQFYGGGDRAWVIDLDRVPIEELRPLFDLPLVAHNAMFEFGHLEHAGITPANLGCTMLAASSLDSGMNSLADLVARRLGWQLDKAEQKSDWSQSKLSAGQILYAALDAIAAKKLADQMEGELRRPASHRCYRLMRDAMPTVARLQLAGIAFDRESHEELVEEWQHAAVRAQEDLAALLGPHVAASSGSQLAQWLENELDADTLASWPRTATGRLRTTAWALERHPDHPLVEPLLRHREATVRLSSFGPSFSSHIHPVTGRIHANFRLGATPSGRMACFRPNLQNPPRDAAFRKLFIAEEGNMLIVADYAQIELRVAAQVAHDEAMLQAYARGEDLHRATAAAVTGKPIEEIDAEERQLAKAVNFGLLYGQGPKGLASYARSSYGVAMTEDDARRARNAFFDAWPGIARWQRNCARAAEKNGFVETVGGRHIQLARGDRPVAYTEALNLPIQGAAAEVLLAALAKLSPLLESGEARLVNVVHDELVLETTEERTPDVAAAIEDAMVAGMLDLFPDAPTTGLVEAGIGPSWGEAK